MTKMPEVKAGEGNLLGQQSPHCCYKRQVNQNTGKMIGKSY